MCWNVIVTVLCVTSNYVNGFGEESGMLTLMVGLKVIFIFLLYNYLYFFKIFYNELIIGKGYF